MRVGKPVSKIKKGRRENIVQKGQSEGGGGGGKGSCWTSFKRVQGKGRVEERRGRTYVAVFYEVLDGGPLRGQAVHTLVQ
jgi:hypothetical protein